MYSDDRDLKPQVEEGITAIRWVKETNDVSPENRMVDQFNHRTGERVIEGIGPIPRK